MNSELTKHSRVDVFIKRDGKWGWAPGVVTYADKCQLTISAAGKSFPIDRKSDRVRAAQ